jgi:hypothetical protein
MPQTTSEHYWAAALVTALVDFGPVLFLLWRVKRGRFRLLKWPLVSAAALFWRVFSFFLLRFYWDVYYRYLYPPWAPWLSASAALLYGAIAWIFWKIALRVPGHSVLNLLHLGCSSGWGQVARPERPASPAGPQTSRTLRGSAGERRSSPRSRRTAS